MGPTLPDAARHVVAAALGTAVFLGLYLGAGLAWWFSVALAVATYGALLVLVRRRRTAAETILAGGASAAQLSEATRALESAAARLRTAAQAGPDSERTTLQAMADRVASIRAQVLADPGDLGRIRRFVSFYLPAIVDSVESYVDLASGAVDSQAERITALGTRIRGFLPIIARIDDACRENDLVALEVEVEVLDDQLTSLKGIPR